MKVLIILILYVFSFSAYSQSDYYLIHLDSAKFYLKNKDYLNSNYHYKLLAQTDDYKRVDLYYLAVTFAKISEIDSANYYLNLALDLGLKYKDTSYIDKDNNLFELKESKYWTKIKNRFIHNLTPKYKINNDIKTELLKRGILDGKYRNKITVDSLQWIEQKKLDVENQIWLDSIINIYGWPDISLVGEEASRYAWTIVQHADNNISFQKKCLKMMKKLLKTNSITYIDYAYLYDRVQINSCEEQLYGTQYSIIMSENGKVRSIEFKPIKNTKYLDKRRAYMKLSPIEKYRQKALNRYSKRQN